MFILKAIGKIFKWTLLSIGMAVFILALLGFAGYYFGRTTEIALPQNMVLQIDLSEGMVESENNYTFFQFFKWRRILSRRFRRYSCRRTRRPRFQILS